MALPKLPLPFLKYFYGISIYLISAFGLLAWHPWVNIIVWAAFLPLVSAIILCFLLPSTPEKIHWKAAFQLWAYQGLGMLVSLLFCALWLTQYPDYGLLHANFFLSHLSWSFFFSTFILINLLMLLVVTHKSINTSPNFSALYPNQRMDWRSLTYIHVVFFQCLKSISEIFFLLSIIILAPRVPLNLFVLACASFLCLLFCRTDMCYQWLQTAIKRWQWRCSFFILALLFGIGLLTMAINWFFQPIYPVSFINFYHIGADSPWIIAFGVCLFLSAPLSYLIAPLILGLSPRVIFLLSIGNPLLWIMLGIDLHTNILLLLHGMPLLWAKSIALISLITSFFWLGSKKMAQLNARFFFAAAYQNQKQMPRMLVQSYLIAACILIACFGLHALFWIQIVLLNFSTWMIGIVFLLIYHYFYIPITPEDDVSNKKKLVDGKS